MTAGKGKADILDVAIVGAGVSGVYLGWRLLDSPLPPGGLGARIPGAPESGPPRVAIFECSNRIGGRLLSVQPPGIPNTFCELGGMRYMSTQPLVRSLIENQLGLATRPFVVDEPQNLNYLRGVQLRNSELSNPKLLPYNLTWAESQDPGNLLPTTIDQLIPGVTKMSSQEIREFLLEYQLDGRHIFDWGFWNLLARGMSREAYEFARATSGYDTPMLNWNAADTISLNFDLSPETQYSAVVHGYQEVPLTLAAQFEQANGEIYRHHKLLSFTSGQLADGSDGVLLKVLPTDDGASGDPITVQARAVVLAMPRRSLELLEHSGTVLDPAHTNVWDRIRSVTPIPLFKLCIAYDYPWWETLGVTQGRTQTDLPIRQMYYWATAPAKSHQIDPDNLKSVLLATYDDGQNVDFWAGLADVDHLDPFEPRQDKWTEKHPGSQSWEGYLPSKAMVAEADRQLRTVHGIPFTPPPYTAAYMDWGVDPYGGGVNFWNIHARSDLIIPAMIRPVEGVPAFICGEAYSNGQGWVEGALETAELVLQTEMGLKPPDWVTAS